jgi:small-conductance mechanosensitive channel
MRTTLHWIQRLLSAIVLLLAASDAAAARNAQTGARNEEEVSREGGDGVPLVVWNRPIADLRATYDDRGPAERAERAAARILAVPAVQGRWSVARRPEQLGPDRAYLFTVNGEFAFRLLESDLDSEDGTTLEEAADLAEAQLRAALDSRQRQRHWPLVLRSTGIALALTVGLLVALFVLRRFVLSTRARLEPLFARLREAVVVGGIKLWPILGGLRLMLGRILTWSAVGGLVFVWLALVLRQFPYTEPWGEALGGFLLDFLGQAAWAVLTSAPDLFTAFVVFALTHAFVRGVSAYFLAVEREEVRVPWLAAETARATRQILTVIVWAFALVIAYPYIPGSHTEAFKGVSVFLGLMISLGSTGLVNQVMSGLTVVYSHAYHHGDYVRIGEQEGRVLSLGLLATRLERASGEVVSVPNAVVTAGMTVNLSPREAGAGEILTTTVTIGYDAPWRQVHALLLLAARRAEGLAPEPAPFVLQRSLSDFYVEYQLVARLAPRAVRPAVLSRLHAEIQDAFNEHGVQILSPHFEGQPAAPVLVPRSAWFAAPAAPE